MHNERNKLTSDLADFVDNPQGIAGDVEYCSMVVAFALLQSHAHATHNIHGSSTMLFNFKWNNTQRGLAEISLT